MKALIIPLTLLITYLPSFGQSPSSFKTIPVNNLVKEYPDVFDLSTPVAAFITYEYMTVFGRDRLLTRISLDEYKYDFPDSTAADRKVTDEDRETELNSELVEYILYKDSVAGLLKRYPNQRISARLFYSIGGKWLNAGENRFADLESARLFVHQKADWFMQHLRKSAALQVVPTDTAAFARYITQNGKDPETFLMQKLKDHKLLMYGETHGRKWSWDLCKRLINNKEFPEFAGTVFMEFQSERQSDIDLFFEKNQPDSALLLGIFRDYIFCGWDDSDRFSFLFSLWHVNHQLSPEKKIRVVFIDTPRVYTVEGLQNDTLDRDLYMAGIISNYLNTSADPRHALLIVGSGHLYYSGTTAGALLRTKMPGKVYSVFSHIPMLDENRKILERIRHGMFDHAFKLNGNQAVAFDLRDSPFGREVFDGLFTEGSGTWQENYDGYIFLGPLELEPGTSMLTAMYDDAFVKEFDRRVRMIRDKTLTEYLDIKELSAKAVVDKLQAEFTPLFWH